MSDEPMVPVRLPIPDGWEAVEVRLSQSRDYDPHSDTAALELHSTMGLPSLIIRRKFVWPDWLKADWVVKDRGGRIWAGVNEPPTTGYGGSGGWMFRRGTRPHDVDDILDIDIPGPWQDSLRLNPRKERDRGTID